MKARIKSTGEIVEVKPWVRGVDYDVRPCSDGRFHRESELEYIKENYSKEYWRNQFSGMILQGIIANELFKNISESNVIRLSVEIADKLINELNKE